MNARLSVALLVAGLGGCGFLGTDGFDGTPVADGVAPFGPDEAVLLCVDGARVAEVTRPPGLCRAEGHEPEACAADADCALPEACVCGRCTVKLCDFSEECPEGTVCAGSPRRCQLRCEADDECGHLGVCESGTCLRACADQSQCGVGELCLAARCRSIACGPGGPNCGPGERCAHQLLPAEASGPTVIAGDGEITLFASLLAEPATGRAVYRFVSVDGVEFVAEPAEPVLEPMSLGAADLAAPSAVATDEGLRIFFEVDGGASIDTALDPGGTGESFGAAAIALVPSEPWEAGRVGAPSALLVDGEVALAYEGGDGAGIGLARSSGGALTGSPAPLLAPTDLVDPERFTQVSEVRDPFARIVTSEAGRRVFRLFVAARGVAQPAEPGGTFDAPNLSIALAAALFEGDLGALALEPHVANPVFGRVRNFRPEDEWSPSLARYAGRTLLYFDAPAGLRVASNPLD